MNGAGHKILRVIVVHEGSWRSVIEMGHIQDAPLKIGGRASGPVVSGASCEYFYTGSV